jgi:hypothetical protein
MGPKWKPKRIENPVLRAYKERGIPLQGDLYEKYFSKGWKLRYTINGPGCNQRTCC